MPFPARGNFNFVFRGIASIAASVASPFTRKRDSSMSAGLSEMPAHFAPDFGGASTARPPLVQQASLKRKAPEDGFDERTVDDNAYPNNLLNIYSPKRSRTPTKSPLKKSNASSVAEIPQEIPQQAPPHPEPVPVLPETAPEIAAAPNAAPVTDSEMSLEPALPEVPAVVASEQQVEPTPKPALEEAAAPSLAPSEAPLPVFSTPRVSTPPSTPKPALQPKSYTPNAFTSPGFAAFAGSASPFVSGKKTSDKKFRASLWAADSEASPTGGEGTLSKNGLGSAFGEPDAQVADLHAISAAKPTQAAVQTSTCPTGEEGEDLTKEVKGVKLFVKRGNKPFASGMVGHLKLLSDRSSQAERLLFRREPLWQVSMNVRVNPSTRCVYDAEESVIRLTLKERISSTKPDEQDSSELVIYALKPGRGCPKQDFKDFAESLVGNSRFKQTSQ